AASPEAAHNAGPAGTVAAGWLGHELLARPANAGVRALGVQRAQQTHRNHLVQRIVRVGTTAGPARVIQRQCACGGTCAACRASVADSAPAMLEDAEASTAAVDEHPLIHTKAAALGHPEPAADIDGFPPGGGPLDRQTRGPMELRSGAG